MRITRVPTRYPTAGVRRRVDFEFPGGHGRTWIQQMGRGSKRFSRHISLWFGQSPEDVDRYKAPRFTLSIDLYREPPR